MVSLFGPFNAPWTRVKKKKIIKNHSFARECSKRKTKSKRGKKNPKQSPRTRLTSLQKKDQLPAFKLPLEPPRLVRAGLQTAAPFSRLQDACGGTPGLGRRQLGGQRGSCAGRLPGTRPGGETSGTSVRTSFGPWFRFPFVAPNDLPGAPDTMFGHGQVNWVAAGALESFGEEEVRRARGAGGCGEGESCPSP